RSRRVILILAHSLVRLFDVCSRRPTRQPAKPTPAGCRAPRSTGSHLPWWAILAWPREFFLAGGAWRPRRDGARGRSSQRGTRGRWAAPFGIAKRSEPSSSILRGRTP